MIKSKLNGVFLAIACFKLHLQSQMLFLFSLEDQLAAINGSDFLIFELDLSEFPPFDLNIAVLLGKVNIVLFWFLCDLSFYWIGNKFIRDERELYNRASLSILSSQFHSRFMLQLFNAHLCSGLFGLKRKLITFLGIGKGIKIVHLYPVANLITQRYLCLCFEEGRMLLTSND